MRRSTGPAIDLARQLRRKSTEEEAILWSRLRRGALGGFRFRRQHPVGHYVLDFYCAGAHLAVEVDGSQHADDADRVRDAWLERGGIMVFRLWNHDVRCRLEAVLEGILERARERSALVPPPAPSAPPPPRAGEENTTRDDEPLEIPATRH
jgi:very-short-patch-repair endonuclease